MERTTTSPSGSDGAIGALRQLDGIDRVLGLYEYAIEGCARRDPAQVTAAVDELIGTLNLEYGEMARSFERLYRFWLERIRDGYFDQVAWSIGDLHDICAQLVSGGAPAAAGARGDSA